jgi:hypothetical protein
MNPMNAPNYTIEIGANGFLGYAGEGSRFGYNRGRKITEKRQAWNMAREMVAYYEQSNCLAECAYIKIRLNGVILWTASKGLDGWKKLVA